MQTLSASLAVWAAVLALAGCMNVRIESPGQPVRVVRHVGVLRVEVPAAQQAVVGSLTGVGIAGTPLGWTGGYTRLRWAALGYRHLSVAVVPVSALTREGVAAKVVAHDDRTGGDGQTDAVSDALSVFAVFEGGVAGVPPADPVARVGQVFSTGLAAQNLGSSIQAGVARGAAAQPATAQPRPPQGADSVAAQAAAQ